MTRRSPRALVLSTLLAWPALLAPATAAAQRADRLAAALAPRPAFQIEFCNCVRRDRPDVEPLRVTGQLVVGAYGGVAGYLLGRTLGGVLAGALPADADAGRRALVGVTAVAGAAAGTALSVYGIGSIGDQGGDLATTFLGTGLGWAAGSLAARLLDRPQAADQESSRRRWLSATIEALLPAVGATIAFNSTRRFDR